MVKTKILVVEDDAAISNLMKTTLELQSFKYQLARTGAEALMVIPSYHPDVIVLDLGLPDMDGVDIIKKVRAWSTIPIIVVSARSEDMDKVEALDAGADDYVTKPFSMDEFLARLRVAFRRSTIAKELQNGVESNIYLNGDIRIDYNEGVAYVKNKQVHLTPIEYRILCLMAKYTCKVLTHNFILKEVWGSYSESDTKSLRVFMATLRKKIEEDPSNPKYLLTHIGVGYRMAKPD